MDGLILLEEARGAGLKVEADRNLLRIRGPRRAEAIARRLIAHKHAVLSALAVKAPPGLDGLAAPARELRVADLDPDWRIEWEERAAILEYDGGIPRKRAEAVALTEILGKMKASGFCRAADTCV
jgi:hypothetical protein